MKFYLGDYLRDTGHLSVMEHGTYMLMLINYCATERPLPVGEPLKRLLRISTRDEVRALQSVIGWFWIETNEGLINKRALREIEKAAHQAAVNRETGKRGGRPRKTDSVSVSVSESVSESQTEGKPNDNPNHSQTKSTLSGTVVGGGFGAGKVVSLTGKSGSSTEYQGGDQ